MPDSFWGDFFWGSFFWGAAGGPSGGASILGELPPLFLGNHWWRNCSSRWCNGSTYSYNSVPSSRTFTTVTAPAKCSSKPLIIPLQPLGYDEN
ncbi:hypothetical protein ACOMHN_063777 [Nucella lapillus]